MCESNGNTDDQASGHPHTPPLRRFGRITRGAGRPHACAPFLAGDQGRSAVSISSRAKGALGEQRRHDRDGISPEIAPPECRSSVRRSTEPHCPHAEQKNDSQGRQPGCDRGRAPVRRPMRQTAFVVRDNSDSRFRHLRQPFLSPHRAAHIPIRPQRAIKFNNTCCAISGMFGRSDSLVRKNAGSKNRAKQTSVSGRLLKTACVQKHCVQRIRALWLSNQSPRNDLNNKGRTDPRKVVARPLRKEASTPDVQTLSAPAVVRQVILFGSSTAIQAVGTRRP